MSRLTSFITIGTLLLVAGCSLSTPSVSDGRRAIEERIKEQSNGTIRLVSFEKIDDQSIEAGGVKGYRMEYKVEFEFVQDCTWSGGSIFGQFSGRFVARPGYPKSELEELANPGNQKVPKGTRKTLTGTLTFEKTERGWRAGE